MTTYTPPVARHPLLVSCPLCDGPATFEPAEGDLDCPTCAVRLEVATDPARALPAAA
jgi:uncharacterized Zn finger protein (UPF0148 family)